MTTDLLIATNPKNPTIIGTVKPKPEQAKQLPKPAGYKIFCAVPDIEKTFENGIAKSEDTVRYEEILANVLFVVELGPEAYQDKAKFPHGPWCKKGDFVLVPSNSGTRYTIHGKEFRMINDDSVDGTVEDPRGISRKYA